MTGKSRRRTLIAVAGVASAVAALLSLEFSMTPRTGRDAWPPQFRSNGERLYFTGAGTDGQPIRATGGDRHMLMMGGQFLCCVPRGRSSGRPIAPVLLDRGAGDYRRGLDGRAWRYGRSRAFPVHTREFGAGDHQGCQAGRQRNRLQHATLEYVGRRSFRPCRVPFIKRRRLGLAIH